jgi:hypothetical protein
MSIGTAKPMPWPATFTALAMATTLPCRSSTGPPELPGLMDASICM